MSGHSKWATIKRKKGAADAARGKLFTKLVREITTAARIGGGDPNGNARLRAGITAAKAQSMPADKIDRAIKKGTGELEGPPVEEIVYEGYGPGGVALVVEALTDNKNRTAGDVRAIFTKGGGSMAATGAVSFQFDRKGVIPVKPGKTEDQVMEAALDAGADDVVADGEGGFEVRTDVGNVHQVFKALEGKLPCSAPKVVFIPKTTVRCEGEAAQKILNLVESLEENDDVQHVYANFEIDDKTMEALSA